MTNEQRDRLRKLAEAATPGPWRSAGEFTEDGHTYEDVLGGGVAGSSEERHVAILGHFLNDKAIADAAYIAAIDPSTILALLAELDDR